MIHLMKLRRNRSSSPLRARAWTKSWIGRSSACFRRWSFHKWQQKLDLFGVEYTPSIIDHHSSFIIHHVHNSPSIITPCQPHRSRSPPPWDNSFHCTFHASTRCLRAIHAMGLRCGSFRDRDLGPVKVQLHEERNGMEKRAKAMNGLWDCMS